MFWRRKRELNRINHCYQYRYKCHLLGFYCALLALREHRVSERLALRIRDQLIFFRSLRSVVNDGKKCAVCPEEARILYHPLPVLNLDGLILKQQDSCGKAIHPCCLQEWLQNLNNCNKPTSSSEWVRWGRRLERRRRFPGKTTSCLEHDFAETRTESSEAKCTTKNLGNEWRPT